MKKKGNMSDYIRVSEKFKYIAFLCLSSVFRQTVMTLTASKIRFAIGNDFNMIRTFDAINLKIVSKTLKYIDSQCHPPSVSYTR